MTEEWLPYIGAKRVTEVQEREAFEAWWNTDMPPRRHGDQYIAPQVHLAWSAWQARAALAAQAAPAGAQKPAAWRAWFDKDSGARWLFTLWPEEERLDVVWEPLYIAAPAEAQDEREAMRMLWEDQSPEEKAHYLAVAQRIAARQQESAR